MTWGRHVLTACVEIQEKVYDTTLGLKGVQL